MPGIASMGLHLGEDAYVLCHTYPARGPILAISTGGAALTLTCDERDAIGTREVEIARALVDAAQRFLSEVERLASDDTAAGAAA
ncbi:hypothetical protein LO762_22520 [Actinocorallia sp. API 0066]|uniref:hypothetical protein n=1 Tax=Actinocorallia sp. API 0066 TaxID=2896846 RepID=UPI001E5860E8|nr:hypothetical protein [Actinocorallia sp. API 0066]MCD0451947.1 hypothetical protein [Actinocorallia sp. API 0066]